MIDEDAEKQGKKGSDDVPLYVEFKITSAPIAWGVITNTVNGTNLVIDFMESRFFENVTPQDADLLYDYGSFSQVKQIRSFQGLVNGVGGPKGIVLPASPRQDTVIHEWGHKKGLGHRGQTNSNNPSSGSIAEDQMAIMYFQSPTNGNRTEINRFERSLLIQ
ncbi:MAG: hypothetical protein ACK4UN_15850 [Limisphaerales bacterium]